MGHVGFLQWNCRGLLQNIDDGHYFLDEVQPSAVCLQETHLKNTHTDILRRHRVFRKDRLSAHSSGGVAVVVRRGVACAEVPLRTPLEAVATRVLVDRLITIVSLYLPPQVPLHIHELEGLIDQLREPFLILGDFNAHNPMWGSDRLDSRGKIIKRLLLSSGLCLLNNKEPTFYSAPHNSFTSIDLSISSPSLFPCFSWNVLKNPFGSDHFPVILKSNVALPTILKRVPRWKLEKADWGLFKLKATLNASLLASLSPEDATLYVTEHILSAAFEAIPQTSENMPKRCKPWWNKDCAST